MNTIEELKKEYHKIFNDHKFTGHPQGMYDAVNYIMSIKGKRIRPILTLLACDLFGGNVSKAMNAAYGIELFHNYSLVHDDIMDNASIRRGHKAVHIKYGSNNAILCGDAMVFLAYQYLLSVPEHSKITVFELFNKTALEVMEGQQMDMDFEERDRVEEDEYIKMIEFKTSVLLAAALQIGSIVADAGREDQKDIYEFGRNLGIAFQLKDDLLDTYGDENFGKRIGGDILLNKKTFLFINMLKSADHNQMELINSMLTEKDEELKINTIRNLYNDLGIKDKTENAIKHYYDLAISNLNSIQVDDDRKTVLREFAQSVNERSI